MARSFYTNDNLLESVKIRMMVPISQVNFSDSDILLLASEEQELELTPDVMRAREEFYVYVENQPINNSSGQSRYPIPYRAIGGKVRAVFLTSGSGNTKVRYQVARVDVENITAYDNNYIGYQGSPLYYVENNDLVFLSIANSGFSADAVEIHFYMRPNELVETSETLTITSINTTTGVISVSQNQIPSAFQSGQEIDFIQAKPGYKTKGYDIDIVSLTPNVPVTLQKTITIDPSDIPDTLEVGDYIAMAGQTPVPQLPQDLQPMLAQSTACRLLEAQGDLDNLKSANDKLAKMQKRMFNLIQDRTEGNAKKIVNRNGFLSGGYFRNGRYRGG